ncbi:MAG: hypothetical protein OXU26_12700 [Acidobacteriota bacterium]|nr:hypothetical protein [Acidobacteriota bacterium]
MVGIVAAFLAMSGSLMGSDPEMRLQVRWGELKRVVGGKKAALQLSDGARVEGRVRKVTTNSVVFKVKKSSNQADYPKGKIELPRATVSRIEVRGLKENKWEQVAAAIGTFVGTLLGSVAVLKGGKVHESSSNAVIPGSVAIAAGAAVLVYRGLAPKAITIIEVLPESPGAGMPKPTNKDSTPSSKQNAPSSGGRESSNISRAF